LFFLAETISVRSGVALLLRGRRGNLVTDNLFFAGPLASQLKHPGRKPLFLGDAGERGDPSRQTPAVHKTPEANQGVRPLARQFAEAVDMVFVQPAPHRLGVLDVPVSGLAIRGRGPDEMHGLFQGPPGDGGLNEGKGSPGAVAVVVHARHLGRSPQRGKAGAAG
jgi:hypothetical protein